MVTLRSLRSLPLGTVLSGQAAAHPSIGVQYFQKVTGFGAGHQVNAVV
ncbi:hypothetical protein MO867_20780 [Microbulbifer sp. OS29]|uniref:Uncharacterized protein n=1 Tax=Microbulbifer okhotskensis TaxID=2926617 RepID=A0A9X2J9M2_9GAMM|nr:hypothetical protein [Microbulbifer okhotskensis]MCO1336766.1 hypothetical protein [Microbulbifer okhotskensis]